MLIPFTLYFVGIVNLLGSLSDTTQQAENSLDNLVNIVIPAEITHIKELFKGAQNIGEVEQIQLGKSSSNVLTLAGGILIHVLNGSVVQDYDNRLRNQSYPIAHVRFDILTNDKFSTAFLNCSSDRIHSVMIDNVRVVQARHSAKGLDLGYDEGWLINNATEIMAEFPPKPLRPMSPFLKKQFTIRILGQMYSDISVQISAMLQVIQDRRGEIAVANSGRALSLVGRLKNQLESFQKYAKAGRDLYRGHEESWLQTNVLLTIRRWILEDQPAAAGDNLYIDYCHGLENWIRSLFFVYQIKLYDLIRSCVIEIPYAKTFIILVAQPPSTSPVTYPQLVLEARRRIPFPSYTHEKWKSVPWKKFTIGISDAVDIESDLLLDPRYIQYETTERPEDSLEYFADFFLPDFEHFVVEYPRTPEHDSSEDAPSHGTPSHGDLSNFNLAHGLPNRTIPHKRTQVPGTSSPGSSSPGSSLQRPSSMEDDDSMEMESESESDHNTRLETTMIWLVSLNVTEWIPPDPSRNRKFASIEGVYTGNLPNLSTPEEGAGRL